MTNHQNPTAILETAGAAAELGAEAAVTDLHASASAWQNEGILYVQKNPRRAIGVAICVGLIAGRLAFR